MSVVSENTKSGTLNWIFRQLQKLSLVFGFANVFGCVSSSRCVLSAETGNQQQDQKLGAA